MGQRRMFSLTIINTARFLRLPIDAQNLYFHLGLRADDDGVVEAFPVMRLINSSEDNLKILQVRDFIKVLNEDLISFIVDWKEHNLIRADRKIDSIYKNLLVEILPDIKLIEPKIRADIKGILPEGNQKTTSGQPVDVQNDDELNKNKNPVQASNTNMASSGRPVDCISKDKLSKDKLSKDKKPSNIFLEKIDLYTNDIDLKKTLGNFVEYRKTIKKPMSEIALDLLLKELDKHTDKIAVINQSIMSGWMGIFELKKQNTNTTYNNKPSHAKFEQREYGEDLFETYSSNLKE